MSATLEQFTWLAVAGLDVSWLAGYVAALSAPGPAEIHASLQLTDPERMVLAAVGNKDLAPALAAHGEVWIVTVDDLLATGGKNKVRAQGAPAPGPGEPPPAPPKAPKKPPRGPKKGGK